MRRHKTIIRTAFPFKGRHAWMVRSHQVEVGTCMILAPRYWRPGNSWVATCNSNWAGGVVDMMLQHASSDTGSENSRLTKVGCVGSSSSLDDRDEGGLGQSLFAAIRRNSSRTGKDRRMVTARSRQKQTKRVVSAKKDGSESPKQSVWQKKMVKLIMKKCRFRVMKLCRSSPE